MSALYLVCLAILATSVVGIKDFCQPAVCDALAKDATSSSRVGDFCKSNAFKMDDRCCRNGSAIVGLDLRNCSLNETSILKHDVYRGVAILDLTLNPALENPDEDDFDGYSSLESLFLDRRPNVACPGGQNSWKIADGGDNETLSCKDQLDTCIVTGFKCPSSVGKGFSHCESHGPGLKNLYCVCNPGYHGYKCLRYGTFPKVPFGAGLGGATVGVAVFLWLTNRRLVK